jgi:site-specific recombinase XerD
LAVPLKKYLDIRKKSWGHKLRPEDYLFSPNGGKNAYTTTALYLSVKKAFRKAGLPSHYSTHSCRHTYATLLLQDSGGELRAVQRQLGHSSINMTCLYAECLPAQRQAAADKLSI